MKRCPQCGTTYTDESLRFCLADGSALSPDTGEPTLPSGRGETLRVDIPPPTTPAFSPSRQPYQPQPAKSSSGVLLKVVVAFLALGALGVILIGVLGVFIYLGSMDSGNTSSQSGDPPVTTEPSAPPASDEDQLARELEKLERQLEDLQKSPIGSNPFPDEVDSAAIKVARVNSPGDGFLALRSLPSHEIGERLASIPDGDAVKVLGCDTQTVTIGGRRGHWCLISWSTYAGWAFDAWLAY